MFAFIFMITGSIVEPSIGVDIPVNQITGKVEIIDKRGENKNKCINLCRNYCYHDKKYHSSHLGKLIAYAKKIKGTGTIFVVELKKIGKVTFIKNSEHTFKPYYGQDFVFSSLKNGSGVNHPDNIKVVTAGEYIILTYNDGRKLIYQHVEKKRTWADFAMILSVNLLKKIVDDREHYNLVKEYDRMGRCTEYFHDEDGYLVKACKKNKGGTEIQSAQFAREEKNKNYSLSWIENGVISQYKFKWMDVSYQFVKATINKTCIDEMNYDKDHLLCRFDDKDYAIYKFYYRDNKVSKVVKNFGEKEQTYRFGYRDGQTDVIMGDLTISYLYDKFARLTEIIRSDGGCKSFSYYNGGALKSISYTSVGDVLYQKEYSYDHNHNITMFTETIDHKKNVWRYCYDDLNRKVEEITPSGLKRQYCYSGSTPFCSKETLFADGVEIESVEYTYDDQYQLISEELISSIGVKITSYRYKNDKPSKVTYSFRDKHSYKETILYIENFSYDNGRLVTKSRCNRYGKEIGKEEFIYDNSGNVISRTDLLGKKEQFFYDGYNRLVKNSDNDNTTKITYLRENLVKSREWINDAQTITIENDCDLFGNKVKQSHSEREEKHYRYDRLNRCIDDNGVMYSYDLLGRVIKKMDNGRVTSYIYGYGIEPTKIIYPDGSFCKRECLGDKGLFVKSTSTDGLVTRKSYNKLGNLIKEECFDKVYTYLYKGKYLVEKRGPEGYIHKFHYDGCGRLLKEEGVVCATYRYDGFSNKIYSCIDGKQSWYEYDVLARVAKEVVGNKETLYQYDHHSNVVSRKIHNIEQNRRIYNKSSKLIKEIENDRVTTYSYGRNIVKKCDFLGNTKTTVYNDAGFEREVSLVDGQGNKKYRLEYEYNSQNLCTKTKSYVYGNHDRYKEFTITYDLCGKTLRQEEKSENGTYITSYVYDHNKRVIKKILPDLVTLNYEYDEYGRNNRIYSSDNTIDYTIEYDLLDRILFVKDGFFGKEIHRCYDIAGNVTKEYFENVSIAFSYKGGQRKRCTFDDMSFVEYSYADCGKIYSVNRFDKDGCYLYSHIYEYNKLGKVKQDIHPFGEFSTRKEYDQFGRCKQVQSPLHSCHCFIEDSCIVSVDNSNGDTQYRYDLFDQVVAENNMSFDYDSLYHKKLPENIKFNNRGAVSFDGSGYYFYDALDRLIKYRDASSSEEELFLYDYYGRVRTHMDIEKKSYVYDGDIEIGEYGSGKIKEKGIINYKTGEKIAIESGDKVLIPLYDLFGNVNWVVDPAKRKVKERFVHTIFGQETILEPNPFNFEAIKPTCPWRYKSMRKYGSKKILIFPERAYNTELGMFLSKDPLLQSFYGSPYHYCFNNPLRFEDADGLAADNYDSNFLPRKIQNCLQDAFSFEGAKDPIIYYVNGLSTNKSYQSSCTKFLQHFFSQTIIPYYRPCKDSFFGVIAEYLGSRSKARSLAKSLKNDFKSGVSEVYLFGHSAGGSTIKKALSLLSRQEAKRINVVTFGSAYLINPAKVKSCVNYYSSRDYFLRALQSIVFPQKSCSQTTVIAAKKFSGLMDHSIMDKTYREKWIDCLAKIQINSANY